MRSALGKGLEALISDDTVASVAAASAKAQESATLPIAKIHPNPKQPRRHFLSSALSELAASIKERGVLQPILVTPAENGSYEIIAGERRWRAAQEAGLSEIPAVVRTGSENERFQMALIENVQREDLNPIEQAQAYKRLQDEFQMTQESIAKVIGKDRAVVANTLRLLQLSTPISEAIIEGKISAGHARTLLAVEDPTAREALFQRILSEQLTVRDVEQAARDHKKASGKTSPSQAPAPEKKSAEVRAIEEELQRVLTRKVELATASPTSQKGWIKLEFYSLDDLDNLIAQLKKVST